MCDSKGSPAGVAAALALLERALDHLNAADVASLPAAVQADALRALGRAEAKHPAARSRLRHHRHQPRRHPRPAQPRTTRAQPGLHPGPAHHDLPGHAAYSGHIRVADMVGWPASMTPGDERLPGSRRRILRSPSRTSSPRGNGGHALFWARRQE